MPVRLFVGNLPYETTEAELHQLFAAIAPPVRIFLPMDRDTGRPRGFAFVEFGDASQGEQAISQFNGREFKGRTMSVSEARARGEGRPPGSPPPRLPRLDRPSGGPPPRGPAGESGRDPFGEESAPRRRRAKPGVGRSQKFERVKRGPIPIRGGGQVFSVDELGDASGDDADFDDFATSLQDDDSESE